MFVACLGNMLRLDFLLGSDSDVEASGTVRRQEFVVPVVEYKKLTKIQQPNSGVASPTFYSTQCKYFYVH